MIHNEEKYDLAMSKAAGTISKLVSDQHQPIIKGKSFQETWNILQERFQHINLMSTSHIIYEAINKKLPNFSNVHEYTSHYKADFDKVVGLLIDTSSNTHQSIEIYFQATMMMNIGTDYSILGFAIKNDWENKTTNLAEGVL